MVVNQKGRIDRKNDQDAVWLDKEFFWGYLFIIKEGGGGN